MEQDCFNEDGESANTGKFARNYEPRAANAEDRISMPLREGFLYNATQTNATISRPRTYPVRAVDTTTDRTT